MSTLNSIDRLYFSGTLNIDDDADFQCKVAGYPKPRITRTLNNRVVRSNSRYHIVSNENGARLVITSVTSEDHGELRCNAVNEYASDYSKMFLQVKGEFLL